MAKLVLTHLLVPPGILVLLLLLAAARRAGSPKGGAGTFAFLALLLWGCSCGPAADWLTGRLEEGLSVPAAPRGDAIVVLGGGTHEGVPDLSGVGVPTDEATARLATAARLYRRMPLPVVVTGGAPIPGRPPEGPIMRRILADLGVPPDKVAVESASRDTFENAAFTRRLLEERGHRSVLLVTSAYHMKRAVLLFEREGLKVTAVPAQFRTRPGRVRVWQDWLPSAGSLRAVSSACKEFLGLAWYRLTLRAPEPAREGRVPA